MVTQISTHSSGYRGFVIVTLPRNARRKITQYHVTLSDGTDSCNSFGKFDALAQALSYIDCLCGGRK
ncbi:hypothetical protein B9P84_18155 [Citrobacter braakii]|nr:hypothetical protein [Citrobacter braakii]MDL4385807.1 hypothetical protein [Citrobacter braakii]OXU10511.1 hypothetical protein B9P84_18155 [Citrobacter braakii]